MGGLPKGQPAKPTLEGGETVAEPEPRKGQGQPAPARRRRLIKRHSSAAEGVTAADQAAEQLHISRATPEPQGAGDDADISAAGCEAAGGDTDMWASHGPAEGASMDTGGGKLLHCSAKRGSASLRPAAADAEDRAQAEARIPGPQQPAKRKRLTKRADPADVAAVGAGRAVGGAGRPEPAGAEVATAGPETGAAAEEGGAAVERTSLVS